MLKHSIIRIAAAACTLLLAGCTARLDPAEDGTNICFTAGSALLREDATKGATLKTEFRNGDKFYVWGTKTVGGSPQTLFNGQEVGTTDGITWTYFPPQSWDVAASRYDFLAITGLESASGIECDVTSSPLSVSKISYNAIDNPSDLMAAAYQRVDGSTEPVHFEFQHILSAVSVVVYNDSPSTEVTLKSYGFKDIATSGTGTVVQAGGSLAAMSVGNWSPAGYSQGAVLGSDPAPDYLIETDEHYPESTITDLMIPQNLEPADNRKPQLVLSYSYVEAEQVRDVTTSIPLEEILMNSSEEPIDKWQPGVKYNYEIHIRLGGGIRVVVTTSDWKEVLAETPGLTIS